jgi:hypothetical protein
VDLLPFFVGASPVADADFVDAEAAFGDLHGDLGFEAEAVFLERNGLENFAAERFVAGLHVSEVDVGKGVGEKSEGGVADVVPEIKNAVGSSTEEARSVNGVGLALEERAQQQRIVGGIVFEVGVLNEDEVPGGFLDAAAESSAFADVARLKEDADLRMSGLEGGEGRRGRGR